MRIIVIAAYMTVFVLPATAGTTQNFVDARGGCRNSIGTLGFLEDPYLITQKSFLGKKDTEWTDEDIAEYRRVYTQCLRYFPGITLSVIHSGEPIVDPPGAVEARVDRRMKELMAKFINPAREEMLQKRATLTAHDAIDQAKEQDQIDAAKEQASRREAELQIHEDTALTQQQAKRQAMREQASRDRDAAERATRLAKEEAPLLEAAEQEANDAHLGRVAAEKHLEEVRTQVIASQQKRTVEDIATKAAKVRRLQAERIEQEKRQDEALAKTCSVSESLFGKLVLGMTLHEVRATLGCVGSLTSSTQIQGVGTISEFRWSGADNGLVSTTFVDGRLMSKSQAALN